MDVILFLQALEPRAMVRLVFAGISWCGDGPLYFLLFPLNWLQVLPIGLTHCND
jgi:hypothetical protein